MIQKWLAKERDVLGQADGCEALASAFWKVLASMLGSMGTRAVFSHAARRAQQDHSVLASLVVTKDALDFGPVREAFRKENPADSRKALVALVDEVFNVLHDLLGPSLTPILREAEMELESKADLTEGEAQAKTKAAEEGSARRADEEKP